MVTKEMCNQTLINVVKHNIESATFTFKEMENKLRDLDVNAVFEGIVLTSDNVKILASNLSDTSFFLMSEDLKDITLSVDDVNFLDYIKLVNNEISDNHVIIHKSIIDKRLFFTFEDGSEFSILNNESKYQMFVSEYSDMFNNDIELSNDDLYKALVRYNRNKHQQTYERTDEYIINTLTAPLDDLLYAAIKANAVSYDLARHMNDKTKYVKLVVKTPIEVMKVSMSK